MTPKEFREAREFLGFSQSELAKEWNMGENGGRSIRRWESGERPVNPIAAHDLKLMVFIERLSKVRR